MKKNKNIINGVFEYIIEHLKACEYVILGGDVLNDMLNYTYDNWYYEVEHESSVIEAIAASASKAVQYLDMYHTKNGEITTTEQYFYDNNGNQISKVVSATHPSDITGEGDYSVSDVTDNYVALYEYNCYNQLVYANTDGVISTYTYAPDGLRASKTVGDVVTMFVYDSANIIEEIVGADTNKYYRGIGIIKNGDGLYYLYNGQGDVAMLTNADGAVVASYTFDAYGNAQQENEVYNPFGYRGEYADSETGFIYLRARYYDPSTGRFINEDPIRDGLNWYVYCENNPIVFIDPWGLLPSELEAAAISNHVYHYDQNDDYSHRLVKFADGSSAGWVLIDVETGREGMKMGVYIREGEDWRNPSEYVLSFKGTTMLSGSNWKNNVEQFLSAKSADMWDAIGAANSFVNTYSKETTMVGHSKGGAEALAAAVSTGKNAIVFNPAKPNLKEYNLSTSNYTGIATSYVVRGDILNSTLGEPGVGQVKYIKRQHTTPWYMLGKQKILADLVNSIRNHLMDAVMEGVMKGELEK